MAEEKTENKLARPHEEGAGGEVKNVAIETYADDMARVVGDNENGIFRKIIEEEEKHSTEDKKKSPENLMNRIFLILGIILVLLSFTAISLVYIFKKEIFSVEVAPKYMPIIFTDKTEFKDVAGLKKDEIIQTILNEINTAEIKTGGIEAIFLTTDKNVLGFRKFLTLMEANLDQKKIEFINDSFLLGATNKESRNPFILLKIRSITDIFEPMRNWENKMFFDLHTLFGVNLNGDTKYLLEKKFEDEIIQNKNARILKDSNGKIIIMYVFAEDDSLIIANSETAVAEVVLRLASSKIKK